MGAAWASSWENDLIGLGWSNGHRPLGQTRLAHQSPFQQLFFCATPSHATAVRCAHSIHVRMSPGIGHVRCETQYRLLAVQEFPIPVDLQHAPAAFDRVVLAMVRRVVHQFYRQLGRLRPLHESIDELAAVAVVLRSVVQVKQ